jgi:hypothetical protein
MPTDTALVTLQRPLVQGIFTSGVFVTANKTATTGVGQFTLRNAEPTPSASTGLAYFGGGTPGLALRQLGDARVLWFPRYEPS